MTIYKRYRWKRRVLNTKWVAHRNGWVNVENIANVEANNDRWSNNKWKLVAQTASGEYLDLRVPRSVREDITNFTKKRDVVSRYLKWVHATPEVSAVVEPATETYVEPDFENANDDELETSVS